MLRGELLLLWQMFRYVLLRKLFKDMFFLQRTQMLARHQKELAHVNRINQQEEDELIRELALDKKRLPKMLRNESKTRSIMFKESLRISMPVGYRISFFLFFVTCFVQGDSVTDQAERLRRFEEQEKARIKNALEMHDQKSRTKVTSLRDRNAATQRELEEIQNEKRKMLLENERTKMAEYEAEYIALRNKWQEDLAPRKMVSQHRPGRPADVPSKRLSIRRRRAERHQQLRSRRVSTVPALVAVHFV